MRCDFGMLIGTGLAIVIAGCGGGSDDYQDLQSNNRAGQAPSDNVATESISSDDAESTVRYAADGEEAPTSTPSVAHREDRSREDRTREVDPPAKQSTDRWRPESQLQAGLLTAGSIDDHAKYDAFRNYLSNTLQRSTGGSFPTFGIGHRIIIRVTNGQGEGIGDARITLRTAQPNQNAGIDDPAFITTTGSDGRALFLSARDLPTGGSNLILTVDPAGSDQTVTQKVSLDQSEWNVVFKDAQQQLPTRLDLALVIDTTGSMQDELNYLKVEIDDIAAAVKRRFPNVEQRFALILYRDEGDEYVTRTYDFTGSLTEFRQKLSQQSAGGGGDYPEAMHLALEQAGQLSWKSEQTARVLFLVGDAPPHSRFAARTLTAIESLRDANVKLFPVAASGARDEAEWIMRSAAFLTMGRYLFLTDHSGVGNPHAKPQTPSYSVERLNALMVRMIASELAGRELLPSDIIATEANAGANPQQVDQPTAQQQFAFPHEFPPTTTAAHRKGVVDTFSGWFFDAIQLPAIRIIAALLAIALIWKLDTRRQRVTT